MRWRTPFGWLTLVVALGSLPGQAAGGTLPVPVQAALYKKILSFDRTLSGAPRVLVVYGDEAGPAAEIQAAFRKVGFDVTLGKALNLATEIQGMSVMYLFPHAASAAALEVAAKAKVLTLASSDALPQNGQAAVGLGFKDGKPEILINLTLVRAESHELASDLLNLATIVK